MTQKLPLLLTTAIMRQAPRRSTRRRRRRRGSSSSSSPPLLLILPTFRRCVRFIHVCVLVVLMTTTCQQQGRQNVAAAWLIASSSSSPSSSPSSSSYCSGKRWTVASSSSSSSSSCCCLLPSSSFSFYSTRTTKSRLYSSSMMQHPSSSSSSSSSHLDDNGNNEKVKNEMENEKLDLKLLLIDHYDSFTYNLVDILGQICTTPPRVLAVDAASSWQELLLEKNRRHALLWNDDEDDDDDEQKTVLFDGIVLSPGPGNPTTDMDGNAGILALSRSIIQQNPNVPILGVCLGHQIMACTYGAKCVKAPTPVHGQIQPIRLVHNNENKEDEDALFVGLSHHQQLNVTRYHSLCVMDWQDTALIPTAFLNHHPRVVGTRSASSNTRSDDDNNNNILMAMRHANNPHFGVQFHPESVGTTHGHQMLHNFCRLCHDTKQQQQQQRQQQQYGISDNDADAGGNNTSSRRRLEKIRTAAATVTTTTAKKESSSRTSSSSSSTTSLSPIAAALSSRTTSLLAEDEKVASPPPPPPRFRIYIHKIKGSECGMKPLDVMEEFLQDLPYPKFWLDHAVSSTTADQQDNIRTTTTAIDMQQQQQQRKEQSDDCGGGVGMSVLGASASRVEYWGKEKDVEKQGLHQWMATTTRTSFTSTFVNGDNEPSSSSSAPECDYRVYRDMDILTYLQQCHSSSQSHNDDMVQWVSFVSHDKNDDNDATTTTVPVATILEATTASHLPFQFRGGHIGYLGYEVRHDTARFLAEQEHGKYQPSLSMVPSTSGNDAKTTKQQTYSNPHVPTAAFCWADRTYVYDHATNDWYLVGVAGRPPPLLNRHANTNDTITTGSSVDDDDDDKAILEWIQRQGTAMRNWKSPTKGSNLKANGRKKASPANVQSSNGKQQQQQVGTNGIHQQQASKNGKAHSSTMPVNGDMMPSLDVNVVNGAGVVSKSANSQRKESVIVDEDILTVTPLRPRETYNRNFDYCLEQIILGESYELCLTNQLHASVKKRPSSVDSEHASSRSPLDLYRILRKRNPAPYAAFLDWNSQPGNHPGRSETDSALAICCSSPERFVSVKRQTVGHAGQPDVLLQVEAKPMKGTRARVMPSGNGGRTMRERAQDAARALALQSSIKDRAENLMIVDLLRNDLSRVCVTGSVHVAKLMDIESFETVHQMVSTIRGTLDATKCSAVDVLKTCFPGGSMTGAPKLRTMELLEEMEEHLSRGPYSGCLGYISLNGAMDMNIIIRAAVVTPASAADDDDSTSSDDVLWNVSIGSGGAITALSECDDEYDEMILKASRVVQAVQDWANSNQSPSGSSVNGNGDRAVVLAQRVSSSSSSAKNTVLHLKEQRQQSQPRKRKEYMASSPRLHN